MSARDMNKCLEPHPTAEGIFCDMKVHPFGYHSNIPHDLTWEGLPTPVRSKSSQSKKAAVVNSAQPETRTGPPTGTAVMERTKDQFADPDEALRLGAQAASVYNLMLDGQWRSLRDISTATGFPEASISARLRDLRKPEFGGCQVERKNLGGGLWEYRLSTP